MAAEIEVQLKRIKDIAPIENADKLEVALIEGWTVIIPKGKYKINDLVVYFPMDLKIDKVNAEKLGVEKYLHRKIDINGNQVLVVGKQKIRGQMSFGFVCDPLPYFEEDVNLSEYFGASKYEPPVKIFGGTQGKYSVIDPNFPAYIDIQNLRKYSNIFTPEDDVVITEKIHGTNFRCGYYHDNEGNLQNVIGTRKTIRDTTDPVYGLPFNNNHIREMFNIFQSNRGIRNCIIYGEIFGPKIQFLDYDRKTIDFVIFDVKINNYFLDFDQLMSLKIAFGLPIVPTLYIGKFDFEIVKKLAEGNTILGNSKHLIEGVVVKSKTEDFDIIIGRKILKYISNRYLGKDIEETTDY